MVHSNPCTLCQLQRSRSFQLPGYFILVIYTSRLRGMKVRCMNEGKWLMEVLLSFFFLLACFSRLQKTIYKIRTLVSNMGLHLISRMQFTDKKKSVFCGTASDYSIFLQLKKPPRVQFPLFIKNTRENVMVFAIMELSTPLHSLFNWLPCLPSC